MPPESYQQRIAEWILNAEARRDRNGKLAVYRLPAGDGGGTFEVAGINDRYHPDAAHELRELIEDGLQDIAEAKAREYILKYTDAAAGWTRNAGIEAFLRDSCWNRGPGGAARILQLALKVRDDGKIGPVTRGALAAAERDPKKLLAELRKVRENYELKVAPPRGARAKFWNGLVNRWNAAAKFAGGML